MQHIKSVIKEYIDSWKYCSECEYYIRDNIKCKCKEVEDGQEKT